MPSPPRHRRGRGRPRGSVYWHAASERWCAQTPPDRRGRRRSKYFADEDEAWDWLDHQLEKLARGHDIFAGTIPLIDYLEQWIELGVRDPERDWASGTVRLYRWCQRCIAESIDDPDIQLEDVDEDVVTFLMADLAEDGRQPSSLALIRRFLSAALADVVPKILPHNPAFKRRGRRSAAEEPEPVEAPWSEAETGRFLVVAETHSVIHPAIWHLMLKRGLRPSEARGLIRESVDLPRKRLRIDGQADRQGRRVERTKGRSKLWIPLEQDCVDALTDLFRSRGLGPGPLFTIDGKPIADSELLAEMRRLRAIAGISPITRAHDMRHQAASLMLANGYTIKAVQTILRHRRASLTLDTYTHMIPEKPVERPRQLSEIFPFGGPKPVPPQHALELAAASRPPRHPSPRRRAVRSAVRERRTRRPPPSETLTCRYPDPLEAPPDQEEQIE